MLVNALPHLVVGLALTVSAWFLRSGGRGPLDGSGGVVPARRADAARMASIGGVTAISLLVLVLAVAAVTSLLARPTLDWVRGGG